MENTDKAMLLAAMMAGTIDMEKRGFDVGEAKKSIRKQMDYEQQKACLQISVPKFRHRNAKRGRK